MLQIHGLASFESVRSLFCFFVLAFLLSCLLSGAPSHAFQVTTSIVPADVFTTDEIGNRSGSIHAVAIDGQGRVFAAVPHENAIFSFDGSEWRKNVGDFAAFSLVEDQHGVVWVGTDSGIFRIRHDKFGKLHFQKVDVPFEPGEDRTMYSGRAIKDGVSFNNHKVAVIIVDQKLEVRRCDSSMAFRYVDKEKAFVTPVCGKGLFKLVDGERTEVVEFKDHNIKTMSLRGDGTIVAIGENDQLIHSLSGSSIFDEVSGLVEGRFFGAYAFDGDEIHISTVRDGYFELSADGSIKRIVNAESGLPTKGVYRISKSRNGDVWLACASSLVRLPRRTNVDLVRYERTEVTSYCQKSIGNEVFVGTNMGCCRFQRQRFGTRTQEYDCGATSDIAILKGTAFAATTSGLFELTNDGQKKLRDGCHVFVEAVTDDLILTSDRTGHLFSLRRDKSSTDIDWVEAKGPRQPFQIRNIVKSCDGVWLAIGWQHRGAVLGIDKESSEISIQQIKTDERIIQNVEIADEFVLLCHSGLRQLAREEGEYRLVEYKTKQNLASFIAKRKAVAMLRLSETQMVVAQTNLVELVDIANDDVEVLGTWQLRQPIVDIPELTQDKKRLLYVNSSYLNSVDLSQPDVGKLTPTPIVMSSVHPIDPENGKEVRVKAKDGIRFQFSVPVIDTPSDQIQYQYQLCGFDKGWSNWTTVNQKEYMNLPGGAYRFDVRARAGDNTSPIYKTFPFRVQTPWFRETWAYVLFSIATMGLILGIVAFRGYRLEEANLRMEALVKLRSEELQQQKETIREKSLALQVQSRESESERLESLSRMLGGIAHDFNNLLCVVSTNCDILKLSLPSDQQHFVDAIHSAGDTAAGLCSQLQSYTGNFPVVSRKLAIENVVEDMAELLRGTVPANLKLTIQNNVSTSPIHADQSEVKQMVLNLVVNACEATDTKIDVRTGEDWYSQHDLMSARLCHEPLEGMYSWVEVSDNGAGISQEVLSKLFDPFFSTKRLGRGLGLAIVSRVVSRQDGALFVSSVEQSERSNSHGTTFRVCFPCLEDDGFHEEANDCAIENDQPRLKLLVVDDEPSILVCLRQYFETLGHETAVAANAEEALDMINNGLELDAALLDISMPGINGDQLALEIQMILGDVPIILMSGFSEKELNKNVLDNPSVQFVTKPFSMIRMGGMLSRLDPQTAD